MDVLSQILTAVLPLVGVLLGAMLQNLFSRSMEHQRHIVNLRTQAYIDYVRSVAQIAHVGREIAERKGLLAQLTDAKTRMTIYATKQVIEELALFEQEGPILKSAKSRSQFMKICQQMRADSVNQKTDVDLQDLEMILFGPE